MGPFVDRQQHNALWLKVAIATGLILFAVLGAVIALVPSQVLTLLDEVHIKLALVIASLGFSTLAASILYVWKVLPTPVTIMGRFAAAITVIGGLRAFGMLLNIPLPTFVSDQNGVKLGFVAPTYEILPFMALVFLGLLCTFSYAYLYQFGRQFD
ncbi:MAG: hypothetical protein U1E49_03375 [Hyphomicrobiaceae bacterium]